MINQLAIHTAGLSDKTDLNDWAVIDYIKDWQLNPKAERIADKVWINYKHMVKMMPCLPVKSKSAISARVNKMVELGIIDTQQDQMGRLFASITEYGHSIISFHERSQDSTGVRVDERGVRTNERGVRVDELILNNQDKTNNIKDYAQTGFDAWWDLHPRKLSKKKCLDIWKSKKLYQKADALVTHLKNQIENCETFDREITKIAYPSTYLNQERYNDEIQPKQKKANTKTNIKAEIFERISKGHMNQHQWKSPEAQQVFKRMRSQNGGVPWNGNEWQINQAIQENMK
jgi:hypothetical protein